MEKQTLHFRVILKRFLMILKRNAIIILAIMVVAVSLGALYASNRKPVYIASEDVIYHANVNPNSVSDSDKNITEGYFATVLDFIKSSCVLDRANFYYEKYQQTRADYQNVNEFIFAVDQAEEDSDLFYTTDKIVEAKYILSKSISTSVTMSGASPSYDFTVKYSDNDYAQAGEKVKILILAADKEANVKTEDDKVKYFGVSVSIQDMGLISIYEGWTKIEVYLTAIIFGIIVSTLVVYIIEISNKKLKDVSQIEEITETDVLACISK